MDQETQTLLLATVGGSIQPLIASLLHIRPKRVLFFPTPDTAKSIPEILESLRSHGVTIDPALVEEHVLTDHQSLESCCRQIGERRDEVDRWLSRGPNYHLVVDFTGGTKCMTAALTMQSLRWPVRFNYVGGRERTKENVGVVVDGKEMVLQSENPWNVQGHQAISEFVLLFDRGVFDGCFHLLDSARKRVDDDRVKSELSTLIDLAKGYAAWEQFNHKCAKQSLQKLDKRANDLRAALGAVITRRLEECLPKHIAHLQACIEITDSTLDTSQSPPGRNARPTLPIIKDLLANAIRRKNEGRFDDAVARLYRSIEAIGQMKLSQHGIEDTGEVALSELPGHFAEMWHVKSKDGKIKLGLQDDFVALLAFGDEAGIRFQELGWHDKKSPLSARNTSILAHGFDRVSSKVFDQLLEGSLALLGIESADLVAFPKLAS